MDENKDKAISLVMAPADTGQIEIVCPECGKGGIWVFPQGFQVILQGVLRVTCSSGHQWGIMRENHDD